MGVSTNRGTPKSSILIGFSIINHPFWSTPVFGNTHIYIYMVTDRIIEKTIALQHARVPTAAGFSIISYSLKKMGKNSSAHFAFLSLDCIIPLSCIFWEKPRFGLSIISWAKNGLNFL